MSKLFNYNTLSISLCKKTRSLHLELNRPQNGNSINSEMVFELESLFSWLTGHLEINSVVIKGSGEHFCQGLDPDEIIHLSNDQLSKLHQRLYKIIHSMQLLPQTIISELKGEIKNVGIELSLGADIRIAASTTSYIFNYLENGLIPNCGGIGLLACLVPHNIAKSWVLSSHTLTENDLERWGLALKKHTNNSNTLDSILQKISLQSPVSRLQAKKAFLDPILSILDHDRKTAAETFNASISTNDWKKVIQGNSANFTALREHKESVQEELNKISTIDAH